MSCGGELSNYDRTKKALINVNLWKSNFVAIWLKYGTFKTVNGVQCFDYYDIDGDGEGQRKMSKHLKQPNLWQETINEDLDYVHLVFDLSRYIEPSDEGIAAWREDIKNKLATYSFTRLTYTIENDRVNSYGFYDATVKIEDDFLNKIALFIAERRRADVYGSGAVVFDATLTQEEVGVLVDWASEYQTGVGILARTVFRVNIVGEAIRGFMLERGFGTAALDALVMSGFLVGTGDISTALVSYGLPVDAVRKMSGYQFVALLEGAMAFDYKVDSNWYDVFLEFASLILAGIALYFGQVQLAVSLVLSFVAEKTDSTTLKIISAAYSIYTGGLDNISNIGIAEATSLLLQVYGLYVELSFKSEKSTEEEVGKDDKNLLYKAPYSAYSKLYCYKPLISVSVGGSY